VAGSLPACSAAFVVGASSVTYFEVLEIPEKLKLDPKDLESRFYALSRKWHPDRFARAGAEEQQKALDMSALLNDAYRALRDPVARLDYFLSLKGVANGDSNKVPPSLLEEVFELNMALEELKMGDTEVVPQLQQAQEKFRGMLSSIDNRIETLFAQWDESQDTAVLNDLRALQLERNYIRNLVNSTAHALEQHVSN